MPALKNDRWELFCQGLFEGKAADQAYADAGYKPNRCNAGRLKTDENIVSRLAELREAAAESAVLTQVEIIQGVRETITAASASGHFAAAMKGWELLSRHWGLEDRLKVEASTRTTHTGPEDDLATLDRLRRNLVMIEKLPKRPGA